MSEKDPALALNEDQLCRISEALVNGLEADLKDKERRTSAAMDVARKLLKDGDWSVGKQVKGRLTPLVRDLPHTDPEEIPRVSG